MSSQDVPKKLDEKYAEKKVFSFAGFPVNIFQEKIKERKVKQSPATPTQKLAYPISNGCFMHLTNLNAESSIFSYELINGEKHCLKGCQPWKSTF
jgi:hypothetical protein